MECVIISFLRVRLQSFQYHINGQWLNRRQSLLIVQQQGLLGIFGITAVQVIEPFLEQEEHQETVHSAVLHLLRPIHRQLTKAFIISRTQVGDHEFQSTTSNQNSLNFLSNSFWQREKI